MIISDFCAYCKKEIKGKMIVESLPILKIRLGFVGGSFHPGCFRKNEVKKAVDDGFNESQAEAIANEEMGNIR
mgnify:CR=1 FL=1